MSNGFYLQWDIEGEKQLSRRLENVSSQIKDLTPAFSSVASTLKGIFSNDVFQTQGAIIGESWSPLKKAYAIQKAKKYGSKGILEATGAMRQGFMTLVKPDMAMVWNKVSYFKYHQSNEPRNKLPRRVMMKLGNQQKEIVVKIFKSYFYKLEHK